MLEEKGIRLDSAAFNKFALEDAKVREGDSPCQNNLEPALSPGSMEVEFFSLLRLFRFTTGLYASYLKEHGV